MDTWVYICIILALILLIVIVCYFNNHKCNCETFFSEKNTPIPFIIHQTWKTKEHYRIPKKYYRGIDSWKKLNPEFQHIIYDDNDCLNFITNKYPQYLNLYQKLELPVQKADVFRYLILHHYGGIYTDFDTICIKPIKELLTHPMIVGIEYLPEFNNGKTQINQWFFGSVPGNPLLLEVVDEINRRQNLIDIFGINILLTLDGRTPTSKEDHTLWLTGPFIFSDIIMKHKDMGFIKIYTRCTLGSFDTSDECLREAYLIHGFEGSWKNNPKPYKYSMKNIRKNPKIINVISTLPLYNNHPQ